MHNNFCFFQATTLGVNLKLAKGGQIYWYMHLDKAIKGNDDVYRFEIIIASLSTNDIELDVINDCNLIGDDLVTYFSDIDKFEDLEFFNSVIIKPFTDSFGDRVSGVTFVVSMTGFRKACITSIPLKV